MLIRRACRSVVKHNLGKSKVSLPHTVVIKKETPKPAAVARPADSRPNDKPQPPPAKPDSTKHEINLAVITIVVGGLAWFMFR